MKLFKNYNKITCKKRKVLLLLILQTTVTHVQTLVSNPWQPAVAWRNCVFHRWLASASWKATGSQINRLYNSGFECVS